MKKIIALLLSFCLLALAGCDLPVIDLSGNKSSPQEHFGEFISSLNSGDYEKSSEYIYNYASLGFSSFEGENEIYSKLLTALNGSRSFSVKGCSVSGHEAQLEIDFTTLDFRKLDDALSSATIDSIDEKQYATGVALDDEEIQAVMSETLDRLMEAPDSFYSTQSFSLQLFYSGDLWKLNCSDAFYLALLGYIV